MDGYAKLFMSTNVIMKNKPVLKKAYKQYRYSGEHQEFLDLITYVAHVGHSHPLVSSAGQQQLQQLVAGQGFISKPLLQFTKTLHARLCAPLTQYYILNSGSEANDLALRMARSHTGGQHYIVFDSAYHGSLSRVLGVSPLAARLLRQELPSTTHTVSPPDLYAGPYTSREPLACEKYVDEVAAAIASIERGGGKLAAFIHEPIAVACGVVLPPPGYCRRVYELVRKAGGVIIADETCCGLGRAGEHFWTFEHFDVVPDIVTVGKALGNGFPTALAATTKDIADHLGDFFSTFGGNPMACSVAQAVLDVVHGEMMLASSRSVGKFLLEELRRIQHGHREVLGQVRGLGLCLGLVIVRDPITRKPDPDMATRIVNRLHHKGFLVWCSGLHTHVVTLTPPLCITQLDARQFTSALRETLDELRPDIKQEPEDPPDPDDIVQGLPSAANSLVTSSPQTSHPPSTASSLDSHTLEDQKLDSSGSLSEHSLGTSPLGYHQSTDTKGEGCLSSNESTSGPVPLTSNPTTAPKLDGCSSLSKSEPIPKLIVSQPRTVPILTISLSLKDSIPVCIPLVSQLTSRPKIESSRSLSESAFASIPSSSLPSTDRAHDTRASSSRSTVRTSTDRDSTLERDSKKQRLSDEQSDVG